MALWVISDLVQSTNLNTKENLRSYRDGIGNEEGEQLLNC